MARKDDEKLTEQIKLLMSSGMLRDCQDVALQQDRSVSDFIRHVVGLYLYGHARSVRSRPENDRD